MTMNFTWRDRAVLITGANGFLGAWLCRALLDAGARVIALVRDEPRPGTLELMGLAERVTRVRGAVEDDASCERALAEYAPSVVMHLAAQTLVGVAQRSPAATFEANIRGTWMLLEACRRHARGLAAVVVASSDKAYGSHDRLPYREDFCLQPRFPYDVSKACADLIARGYFHGYGLPVAVTRCANLYGGGDLNWSRIVPGTIRAALQGERPVVRSDGSPVRDYLYIEDAVRGYLLLAESLGAGRHRGDAFNLGTDQPLAVLDLVHAILGACGRGDLEPDIQGTATGEIDRQFLDPTLAAAELGWRAETRLEVGLARTVAWYREHHPW